VALPIERRDDAGHFVPQATKVFVLLFRDEIARDLAVI